jgi:uncharacterized protein
MSGPITELEVTEVLAAVPMRPGLESGLVVLTEISAPNRSLSMYIGQAEARAVQAGRRGEVPARPSTWDLYLSTLALLGAELAKAVIDGVEESRHFFARLEIRRDQEHFSVACRPSDAIALVVRQPTAALYATDEVLLAAGHYPGGGV